MNIIIRKASLLDLETVNQFQHKLAGIEKEFTPSIKNMRNVEYYDVAKLIKSPKVLFLVAEIEGNLIGCCFGEIKNNRGWQRYNKGGYIGLMFIRRGFRKKGIGKLFVKEIVKWFHLKKIKDIRLDVYSKNRKAVNLYKRMGFKDHITEMIF